MRASAAATTSLRSSGPLSDFSVPQALISRLVIIASTRNRWTRMGKTLRQLPGVTTGFELDGARPGEPV
ncbi:Uncharacterised protein [Mycobacteroides abscessus subsp. abscessus]|nr:Uncharacterised protein [Mycobacteroides abscessus subsp. abscessus]